MNQLKEIVNGKVALEELKQWCSVRGNLPKFPTLMYEAIKKDLEILEILLKCLRVSTINYDDNDYSTSCEEFCFEFDELSNEEYLKLCKYLSKYIKLEVKENNG